MNYDEAKIEATKIEEVENSISKVNCAIVVNTILETTMKGNTPKIIMSAESYIDETDKVVINRYGKEFEKFRVKEYIKDNNKRESNPDYDLDRIIAFDLPGYLKK